MLLPLPTPFAAGLGQRAESARSRLLWDADFRTMPRQILPTTQAVWKALIAGSYAGAAAAPALSNAWIFDQATVGDDAPDFIGGKTLTNVSGSVDIGEAMVGLLKGAAGQRWHRAAEFPDGGTSSLYTAANAADFNPAAASWGLLLVFRHGVTPTATGVLVSKASVTGGWRLERQATGQYRFVVREGVNTATLNIATPPRDSAPHYLFVRVNRASGQLEGFTDMGAVAPVSLGAVGSISSAVPMIVGSPLSGHFINRTVAWQCAWLGIFTGAAAESVTSTHMGRFWTHAKRPAAVTTFNRAGRVLTEIENDPVLGIRLAGWQSGQLAWERDPDFPGYGLGASAHSAVVNRVADSSLETWTQVDVDTVSRISVAPNGIREAMEVGPTVPDEARLRTTVALTAGELAQFSVYAGQFSGTGQIALAIYDATFTTLKIQTLHTVSSPWERLSTTGWEADATATFGLQISFTSSDMVVSLWGAQLRVGDYDGPLAWSDGVSHTVPATDIRVTGVAAAILRAEEGELVAEYSCAAAAQATDRFVVDVSNAGSNVNRRAIKVAAAGVSTLMYDSGGVDRVGPVLAAGDQEKLQHLAKRAELAWAATRFLLPTFRARLRMPHDAEADAGGVTTALANSATVTTAWLGQSNAAINALNGVLRRVRCYGAAAP